jgi:hypothetical protein
MRSWVKCPHCDWSMSRFRALKDGSIKPTSATTAFQQHMAEKQQDEFDLIFGAWARACAIKSICECVFPSLYCAP